MTEQMTPQQRRDEFTGWLAIKLSKLIAVALVVAAFLWIYDRYGFEVTVLIVLVITNVHLSNIAAALRDDR